MLCVSYTLILKTRILNQKAEETRTKKKTSKDYTAIKCVTHIIRVPKEEKRNRRNT